MYDYDTHWDVSIVKSSDFRRQRKVRNAYHKMIKREVSGPKPFQLFRLYPISKYSTANVRPASKFFS